MAARALYRATIRVGKTAVPVKLYGAVEDREVHFRLLHEKDGTPVKQRMVHPKTGKEVPAEEVRRGVEVEPGVFVVVEREEIEGVAPKPSRDITLSRVVPAGAVDQAYYDRPYFLGPDGDERRYFALAEALEKHGHEAIAHWVMRKREQHGALRASDGRLELVRLRFADEVVPASSLPRPAAGRALDPKERKLAEQLVEALAGPFEPEEFHDTFRERVQDLVKAKARGGTIEVPEYKPRKAEGSLAESLRASLRAQKEKRVA
jgi:DNA end-binding protein Ku